MAVKKEEAQNAADRAAQQGLGIGIEGQRAGEQAADATRRVGEEQARAFNVAAEEGRRTAETAADATRNVAQFGRDQAQRGAEAAQQTAQDAAKAFGASAKSYGELAERSRGGVEAVIHSSARIARGLQEMGWEIARFSQDSLRSNLRIASDMMHCRSIEDVVEVQSNFVRESMDRALDQQARLLRLSRATAEEAEQVIKERPQEARPQ